MPKARKFATPKGPEEAQVHNIDPVYDEKCRILILGSFPSTASRDGHFFYSHPQNRFWKVLAEILGESETPKTIEQKKKMLLNHSIALWDVINSCTIIASSDSSIKNVKPSDLNIIMKKAKIDTIFTNGTTADDLYKKYGLPVTGLKAIKLPSTSPANATWQYPRLLKEWLKVKTELDRINSKNDGSSSPHKVKIQVTLDSWTKKTAEKPE